jgi:hypothetical protein
MAHAEHLPSHANDPTRRDLPEWEQAFLAGRTRSLLHAGVPLSLLLDLADPHGPASREVYAHEPGDAGWVPRLV